MLGIVIFLGRHVLVVIVVVRVHQTIEKIIVFKVIEKFIGQAIFFGWAAWTCTAGNAGTT